MFLQKLESVKIISRLLRLLIAPIAAFCFYAHIAHAEDIEPWDPVPIPATTPTPTPTLAPILEGVGTQKDQIFEGAKNKPPFSLEAAKQCEQELEERRITFSVKDQISDEKGCIVERPLSITELSGGIALSSEMTLRCKVVLAMDDWTKNIVRPSAKLHLGQDITSLKTSTSYHCRTRNNKPGGKISEHGFANGVDITGFELADETVINVSSSADTLIDKQISVSNFRAAVRAGACAYFTTVLGPGTNATHQDHFHFDLAYRKSGYRLCE